MNTEGPQDVHLLLDLIARSDSAPEDGENRFLAWLASGEATPDDRHRFVLGANYDFTEPDVIEWIVRQPDCDRATALLVFWRTGPGEHLLHPELADGGNEYAAMHAGIRERWRTGFYVRSELAFPFGTDPLRDDFVTDADFDALERRFGPEAVDDAFPREMRASLPGRTLSAEGTIEGIPNRFWPREWFDAEGNALPAGPGSPAVAVDVAPGEADPSGRPAGA